MPCKIKAVTNGNISELGRVLYAVSGSNAELADSYYNYMRSDEFKSMFGDWEADFQLELEDRTIPSDRVDDNGEPKLIMDEVNKKYYYLDKFYTRRYYPITLPNQNLGSLFSESAINEIAKYLTFEYMLPRVVDGTIEIDMSVELPQLKDFIYDAINDRAVELSQYELDMSLSEEAMMSAYENALINSSALSQSLMYLDEWVEQVNNVLKSFKLREINEGNYEDIEVSSEFTKGEQAYGTQSYELSPYASLPDSIRLSLSMLKDPTRTQEIFGESDYVKLDTVMTTLSKMFENIVPLEGSDLLKDYIAKMEEAAPKQPFLYELIKRLNNSSEDMRSKYTQVFNQASNSFYNTVIEKRRVWNRETKSYEEKTEISFRDLTNTAKQLNSIKNNWYHNFKILYLPARGDFSFDTAEFNQLKESIDALNKRADSIYSDDEAVFNDYKQLTFEVLNSLGVDLQIYTDENGAIQSDVFEHYLDGLEVGESNVVERRKNFRSLISGIHYLIDKGLTPERAKNFENIFDTQSVFAKLAESYSYLNRDSSTFSIFSGGKNKYILSKPSYVDNKVGLYKRDPMTLLRLRDQGAFYQHSNILNTLFDVVRGEGETDANYNERVLERANSILKDVKVVTLNSFQERFKSLNSKDAKDIKHLDLSVDLINKTLNFRKPHSKALMMTPMPAEKGTMLHLELPRELMINSSVRFDANGTMKINESALLAIYNQVLGEFNRIKEVQQEIEESIRYNTLAREKNKNHIDDYSDLHVHYHLTKVNGEWVPENGNGTKFQMIDALNNPEIAEFLYIDGKLNTSLELLNPSEIFRIRDIKDSSPTTFKLIEFIGKELTKSIEAEYKNFESNQLFDFIDGDIKDFYDGALLDDSRYSMVADYVINNINFAVEYSKLFSGDYAYYKNMDDYKKRIPGTYSDGNYMRIMEGDPTHFNMAVIENVDIGLRDYIYKDLVSLVGEEIASFYESRIDSTDAQAWITPDRWKFIMKRIGKWSSEHDTVWDKLTGKNLEPFTLNEHKLLAQPLKGVYFDVVDGIPTYLKYSQAVLTDMLVKGSTGLKRLRDHMEKYDVDELVTHSGVKVGAIQPSRTHNADGDVLSEFKLNPIMLSNYNWKLQQDLTPKGFGQTDVGSQAQQMVFAALYTLRETPMTLPSGEVVTGNDLAERINNLVGSMTTKGMKRFLKSLGANKDGVISEGEGREQFFKTVIESLKSRGTTPNNVIKALEAHSNPYAIPGFSTTLQQTVSANVRKSISKIKTNGGSFIQMADYGFSKNQATEQGVKWAPWAEDHARPPGIAKDENGKDRYNTYIRDGKEVRVPVVRPGEVFISGNLISRFIPDWQSRSTEELFGTAENNYKDGLIDNRILHNIVGYRIPTQGLASMDALRVVGILPDANSDTVVAYTGITTKTGSDYDIDKMYMMLPDIKVDYQNKQAVSDVIREYTTGRNQSETVVRLQELLGDLDPDHPGAETNPRYQKTKWDNKKLHIEYLTNAILESISESNLEYAPDFQELLTSRDIPSRLLYDEKSLGSKLVEYYSTALSHFNIMDQVMTPIDFPFMSRDVEALEPLGSKESFHDFNMPREIDLRMELMIGTIGVGAAANAGKDHIRGLFTDGALSINGKRMDMTFSESLSSKDLDYYSKFVNLPLSEIQNIESIRIADTLSALLNAFVDIANDNYITRANWNTRTFGAGMMLIRTGVHPFKVNAFLSSPILKEFVRFSDFNESVMVDNTGAMFDKFRENIKNRAIDKLPNFVTHGKSIPTKTIREQIGTKVTFSAFQRKFGIKLSNQQISELNNSFKKVEAIIYQKRGSILDLSDYSLEAVHKMTRSTDNSLETLNTQMNILAAFEEFTKSSREVSIGIKAAKPDTYSYGKDLAGLLVAKNLLYQALTSEKLLGFENKLMNNGKPTYLYHMIKRTLYDINKIFGKNVSDFIEAHPTVQNTYNFISQASSGNILTNESVARDISKSYLSYMMSGLPTFQITPEARTHLLQTVPNIVADLKDSVLKDNAFVEHLELITGSKGESYVGIRDKQLADGVSDAITEGWMNLYNEFPTSAEMLVQYSYIVSGFQNNLSSFFQYIPYEIQANLGINEHIKKHARELSAFQDGIDFNFIDQFFRHNLDDTYYTRRVFDKDTRSLADNIPKTYGFMMNVTKEPAKMYVYKEHEVFGNLGPEVKKVYYKLQGVRHMDSAEFASKENSETSGETESSKSTVVPMLVYSRVSEMGHTDQRGNKVFEYNKYSTTLKSSIKTNENALPKKLNASIEYIEKNLIDISAEDYISSQFINMHDVHRRFDAIVELVERVNKGDKQSAESLGITKWEQKDNKC